MREPIDAVVLCAGLGKRLAPLTTQTPKVLVPVGGKPLLASHLEALRSTGIRHVVLVVGHRSDAVREYVAQRSDLGLEISFREQREPRGTGDAVLCALPEISSDPFLVIYGDVFVRHLPGVLEELVASKESKVAVAPVDDASEFGRIERERRSGQEYLVRIVEKDGTHRPGLVNAGLYALPLSIRAPLERASLSQRGEIELPEALEREIARGHPFRLVRVDDWVDVGSPERLAQAERLSRA